MSMLKWCLILGLTSPLATAQVELQRFVAETPLWGDELGSDVAADGDLLAVSRPGSDVDGIVDRGAIRVYRWIDGTWELEQEIVAPDAGSWDRLGSCALKGERLVAGAPYDDVAGAEDAGSVHVFEPGPVGWTPMQTVVAPDGATDDRFGAAVALHGDLLVVGAPLADAPSEADRGKVYVYRLVGGSWTWEATLLAGAANARLGTSVDVEGDVLVAGAPGATPSGKVHVWRHGSSWGHDQTISYQGPGIGAASFGESIALNGARLAVAAPNSQPPVPGFTGGSAYVYDATDGEFEHDVTFYGPTGMPFSNFASDVDLADEWIAIGSPTANGGLPMQGAVYVFRYIPATGNWVNLPLVLYTSEETNFGSLGRSVALDGPILVAGSPQENVSGNAFQGSATAFSIMGPDWAYAGGGLAGEQGVPDLVGRGTLAPASTVNVSVGEARPGAPLVLIAGLSALEAPFKGGTLVPAPTLVVFGLFTNASGGMLLSTTWPSALPPGLTLWLQAWVQDPAGALGWAATNALSATQP